MSLDARRLAAAGAAILAGIALGCLPWPRPGRVAVLAFEGLDPRAIDLLLAEGRLPSFARLRREGAYGRLEISSPREAALLWRTATTGRLPGPPPRSDEEADSPRRTGPLALWNILSMTGRKVVVVGGPGTSPVEPVVGVMVSEQLLADRVGDTVCCPDGLTYPPDLQTTLQLLVRPSSRATGPEGPARVDDDLELAYIRRRVQIGFLLWREERPDLLLTYLDEIESISQRLGGAFRSRRELDAAAHPQPSSAIEQLYQYVDLMVGEALAEFDEDTTLVVLSTHGFDLAGLGQDQSLDAQRGAAVGHDGMLYLHGRGVRRGRHVGRLRTVDVAPTLLALVGLPPAADMPGRVATDALDLEAPGPRVVTYEAPDAVARARRDVRSDDPGAQRAQAARHLKAGRPEQAARILEDLVRGDRGDSDLLTKLAGALAAKGSHQTALTQIDAALRIDPLGAEAHHTRGVILELLGESANATAAYRSAVLYRPEFEPSRHALRRLTGSADAYPPRVEAERRARELAEVAGRLARSRDYASALRLLDEAEQHAPRYVLVHQYRANVAYLMGNLQLAAESLANAVALEPDNALLRANLARLEERRP